MAMTAVLKELGVNTGEGEDAFTITALAVEVLLSRSRDTHIIEQRNLKLLLIPCSL